VGSEHWLAQEPVTANPEDQKQKGMRNLQIKPNPIRRSHTGAIQSGEEVKSLGADIRC